ncbi:MAG: peptidase M10 [Chitinophagaceae bacterium]|nr:peptidase M10 [Chitinophagaceae bacterium]
MGEAELNNTLIVIHSHIVNYGNAATPSLAEQVREEIETMWNEPRGQVTLRGQSYRLEFRITASFQPEIEPLEIYQNTDPRINYFRIEEFAHGNISFVDGIGCNTGYFKLENLYVGSTTAAHEYGHTIGLMHPEDIDIRNQGIPGIMYPRGTLVDSQYQYNPQGIAGDSTNGGTMHPKYRKVLQADIDKLDIPRDLVDNGKAIIGEFTSVWHPDHATINL